MLTNFNVNNKFIKHILNDDPEGFRKYYKLTPYQLSTLKRSPDVIRDLTRIFAKKSQPKHRKNLKELRDISKDFDEKFREMEININKLKGDLCVSCFSEDYKSILMWSHYAEDHTGFCVKYNFKSLGYNHHLTRNLFPVLYIKEIFPVDNYLYQSMYSKDATFKNVLSSYMMGIDLRQLKLNGPLQLNKEKTKFNNMFYVYAALNKFEGWKYEKEWRYVITYKNELKSRFIEVPQPSAIYLGATISSENKNIILEIATDKEIDVYQMHLESKDFVLKPKKIL